MKKAVQKAPKSFSISAKIPPVQPRQLPPQRSQHLCSSSDSIVDQDLLSEDALPVFHDDSCDQIIVPDELLATVH